MFPDYQSNSSIFLWNAYDFLCGGPAASNPTWSLAGYALFQGHYTAANLSSAGSPLRLDPPLEISCPAEANPSTSPFFPIAAPPLHTFLPTRMAFGTPPS